MDNAQAAPPNWPIVESYRYFDPPPNFRHLIETLLRNVPGKYLIGLETVILTNRTGLTRNQQRQSVWSRKRKTRLAEALGSYSQATKSSTASVWIYVDNLVDNAGWMLKLPFLRYMMPGAVLYHEIGHHIHRVHKPIHEEREDVAEDWSRKLYANFVRKHYWYLYPAIYVLARVIALSSKLLKRKSGP